MLLYLEFFLTGQLECRMQEGYLDGQKVTRVSPCDTGKHNDLSVSCEA